MATILGKTDPRLHNFSYWHDECSSSAKNPVSKNMARILVVEDDPLFLWTLNQFLKKEGHDVFPVTAGESAFALAQEQLVDVVISDFRLPGLNGRDLLRKIRTLQPQAKVIMISAYQREETGDEEETPWHVYLNKPIELGTLTKLLDDLTDGPEVLPQFTVDDLSLSPSEKALVPDSEPTRIGDAKFACNILQSKPLH